MTEVSELLEVERHTQETESSSQEGSHNVYDHPDGRSETIKNGFSWPACLVGAFWAWAKGMVLLGFGLLALGFLLSYVTPVLFFLVLREAGLVFDFALSIAVVVWVGSQGNEWRRRNVLKRGFELRVDSVSGDADANADLAT